MLSTSTRVWIHLKTMFQRVTFTRTSLLFFLATVGFCFLQGVVQAFLFSVDQDYSSLVASVLDAGEIPYDRNFAFLRRDHDNYSLTNCTQLPGGGSPGVCEPIFSSTGVATFTNAIQLPNGTNTDIIKMNRTRDANGDFEVNMIFTDSTNLTLNHQCLSILIYPDQVLKNAKREELALMGSQFWLLATITYAIVSESVPHLVAALVVRVCDTVWSGYAIWRTTDVQQRFDHLVLSDSSPCNADLFPRYLERRQNYEIPDFVFSLTALILSSYMSWKLMKVYKEHTLGRIGTTPEIQQIYRFYMAVLACLQLAVYFMLTSLSLWLDQLLHGAITNIATFRAVYEVQSAVEIALLVPWIVLGWYSITREHKLGVAGFIAWAAVLLITNAVDFHSVALQWTYIQWPFFGSVTTASLIVLVFTIGFTSVCTARFGRGFANYLYVERVLAESDFAPDEFANSPASSDLEKAPIPWEFDEPQPMQRIALPTPPPASPLPQNDMVPTYLRPFGQ